MVNSALDGCAHQTCSTTVLRQAALAVTARKCSKGWGEIMEMDRALEIGSCIGLLGSLLGFRRVFGGQQGLYFRKRVRPSGILLNIHFSHP
jgi:hypothetical protein